VITPENARDMFEQTGVDAVMIGRSAMGNPWIFREIRHFLDTGEHLPPPSWQERLKVIKEHLIMKCDWQGEKVGVLEMRKMYGGYLKGFHGAVDLRHRLMQERSREGVLGILDGLTIDN